MSKPRVRGMKNKKSHSPKTKKRLGIKAAMLATRKAKKTIKGR